MRLHYIFLPALSFVPWDGRNRSFSQWPYAQPSPEFTVTFFFHPDECISSVQLLSRDLTDCNTPGFSVHHQLPVLTKSHGCWSQWCHRTISSSIVPFSSHLRFFPASGSSPVSQFFTSSGQTIGVSVLASVLPVNIQDWFPLGWTGRISLQSKWLWRIFSNTTVQKH